MNTHDRPNANTTTSATAATTPSDAALGVEAHDQPERTTITVAAST